LEHLITTGKILSCRGGFYYVETPSGTAECRARGIFRRTGEAPLAGDTVEIAPADETASLSKAGLPQGNVERILPRRNSLARPPLANLDCLGLAVSMRDPAPNLLVLDKLLAIAEQSGIPPLLIFTKTDLDAADRLTRIYAAAGYPMFTVSIYHPETADPLRRFLAGKTAAVIGNSGAGKSSLLNLLFPALALETGGISQKLGRGRHTTRVTELHPLPDGGYIADTPGFSSVDIVETQPIPKDQLPFCFPEFAPYLGRCRFTSCSHTTEKGCAVLEAVAAGHIARERHETYVAMFNEVKDRREWQTK